MEPIPLLLIAGPTASGKSARAVEEALKRGGEVISVDSRQVYRTLNIGTEKISREEMRGIPHHLIDILESEERYSAGSFVQDAERLIGEIRSRGKLPILAGGTHYYFDSLLYGIPVAHVSDEVRAAIESKSNEQLYAEIESKDPERATELDPHNRRRLIRAAEFIAAHGKVPRRAKRTDYQIEWIVVDPEKEVLWERIESRLKSALDRGLVEEVRQVRERVGDERLNEFGLEYRIVGEYLRGERDESSLLPSMNSALRDYARRQKAWLRKLAVS